MNDFLLTWTFLTKSRFTSTGSAVDVSRGREENWPDEKIGGG